MNDFILLKIKSPIQHIALRFLHGQTGMPQHCWALSGHFPLSKVWGAGLEEQGPQQGTLKCPEA